MVEAKQDFVGEGTEIPATNRSKYAIDERVLEHELRRRLWEGAIPLKIDLSVNDLFAAEPPRSLYVSVSFSLLILRLDYGSTWELLLLYPGRCKGLVWQVRTPGETRQVRWDVLCFQWVSPQVEPARGSAIWCACRLGPQAGGTSLVTRVSLQR